MDLETSGTTGSGTSKVTPSTGCSGMPGTPEGRGAGVADADQLTQEQQPLQRNAPSTGREKTQAPHTGHEGGDRHSVMRGSCCRTAAECWCATWNDIPTHQEISAGLTPGHRQGGESAVK